MTNPEKEQRTIQLVRPEPAITLPENVIRTIRYLEREGSIAYQNEHLAVNQHTSLSTKDTGFYQIYSLTTGLLNNSVYYEEENGIKYVDRVMTRDYVCIDDIDQPPKSDPILIATSTLIVEPDQKRNIKGCLRIDRSEIVDRPTYPKWIGTSLSSESKPYDDEACAIVESACRQIELIPGHMGSIRPLGVKNKRY